MSVHLLDKAYKITTSGGVAARRVVVAVSGTPGSCALPAAANAAAALGVSVTTQSTQGRTVTVRKAGIVEVVAAGAIGVGVPVNVAGTSGKVKAIDEASTTKVNCLGFTETSAAADGDVIEVFLSPHQRIV